MHLIPHHYCPNKKNFEFTNFFLVENDFTNDELEIIKPKYVEKSYRLCLNQNAILDFFRAFFLCFKGLLYNSCSKLAVE